MSGDLVMSAEDLVRQLASLTVWGPGRLTEGVQPSDGFEDSHDSLMRLIESARQVCDRMEDQARKVSAYDLRRQAVELLEQAKAMDGLRHVMVAHEHEYGTTMYVGLFDSDTPSEEEAVQLLQSKFEPERDECLTIEAFNLQDLTGGQDEASSQECAASQAKPEVANSGKMGAPLTDLGSAVDWSPEDQAQANADGWGIYEFDDGHVGIQPREHLRGVASDRDAVATVILKAHVRPGGIESRAIAHLRNPNDAARWVGFGELCKVGRELRVPVEGHFNYLYADGWGHCFVGSQESTVRWLYSYADNEVIYAEIKDAMGWRELSLSERQDLTESIVGTNEVPSQLDEFDGVVVSHAFPDWVPQPYLQESWPWLIENGILPPEEDRPAPQG